MDSPIMHDTNAVLEISQLDLVCGAVKHYQMSLNLREPGWNKCITEC